jgi:hypothetical protein
MGREGENLPRARASRPSAAGAQRRVPRLVDYTGGRLSFGNERAVPLVFPAAKPSASVRLGRQGRPEWLSHTLRASRKVPFAITR